MNTLSPGASGSRSLRFLFAWTAAAWRRSSLRCWLSATSYLGCNRFPVVGVVVLVRRPNRRWAGLVNMRSDGVFLTFNKPMNGSDFSALQRFIIFLAFLTAASAAQFALLFPGLMRLWSNSHFSANFQNASDENCGPLSLITVSGMPCLAK